MSKIWKELIRGAVLGFVLPAILVTVVVWAAERTSESPQASQTTKPMQTTPTISKPEAEFSSEVTIPVLLEDHIVMMELEVYLLGVVLSEMPASFESEALKAQAVAARTFALKIHTDGYKHMGGAVCANAGCCQGYLSPRDYLDRGWSQEQLCKVTQAVRSTQGQVLIYEGKLISATYFACSGGSTESAAAVWGQDVPYLQAVESPGEEETVYFTDRKLFAPEELQNALGILLEGNPETWFGIAYRTDGGGIDTIQICGVSYRGTTLRTLLGLRSTMFTVKVTQEGIEFTTYGYGHRVGMSQYGADAMAMTGSDYRQILDYYYRGAILVEYTKFFQANWDFY